MDDAVVVQVVQRPHELLGDVLDDGLGQLLVVLQDLEQLACGNPTCSPPMQSPSCAQFHDTDAVDMKQTICSIVVARSLC